jgi:hypothetical protein
MFESSHPSPFLDYFRIPYRVVPGGEGLEAGAGAWGSLRSGGPGGDRTLMWPRTSTRSSSRAAPHARGVHRLGEIAVPGFVVTDDDAPEWLRADDRWLRAEAITDASGARVASVRRDPDGNVVLPFDPGEVLMTFWSEGYVERESLKARARRGALKLYYLIRPMLPRSVQLALRRRFARLQRAPSFPAWPVETSLLEFCDWTFSVLNELAGRPVPWLAPWPEGRTWALVLTHDVETRAGFDALEALRSIERALGFRSSWNLVPLRYHADVDVLEALKREGCEIGVHGLRHDGRDLGSLRKLRSNLPEMRRYAERWGAQGFRAPATQRRWEWMPLLGFDYDSSYPDTDPYEPQPGGSCSYLPFMNRQMVELPITLPQDHALFAILGRADGGLWIEKAGHIGDWGGMALALTHPDYAGDRRVLEGYESLLRAVRDDPSMWHALPCEVSAWWRRRADSHVEEVDGDWVVGGPAAGEAVVRLARPGASALRPPRVARSIHSGSG